MGQVIASALMSSDGDFVGHDDVIGEQFEWLQDGYVEIPSVDDRLTPYDPSRRGPTSNEHA